MPLAAGFVGILPALGLLDVEKDGVPAINLSWWSAIAWSLAVAFFGCASLCKALRGRRITSILACSYHRLFGSK